MPAIVQVHWAKCLNPGTCLNSSSLIRAFGTTMLNTVSRPLDATDLRLLESLRRNPHASVSDAATTVGIARGTVYSRIERLERERVITGYGPDVDAVRAGLTVLAFTTLEIAQGSHA